MAKNEENGTKILLGLKDYKVIEVVESEEKVIVKILVKGKESKCLHCGSWYARTEKSTP
jgi:transposase